MHYLVIKCALRNLKLDQSAVGHVISNTTVLTSILRVIANGEECIIFLSSFDDEATVNVQWPNILTAK